MKMLRQILGPFLALLLTFGSVAEVSAPVTVAAAGVVLGVGHAQAATPAQKAVVLNSVPGWVLRASGALPSIDMDFAHNRAWVGGSGPRAPPSLLTTTRASTGYAQWADGHLSSFASNVPRITDLGLLVEQAATNLALQSQTFDNSSWAKTNASVTADAVTAPDGTLTADKLVESSATGFHQTTQSITVVSATTYTWSEYLKAGERTGYSISLSGATTTGIIVNGLLTGAGTATVAQGSGSPSATITAVANGFYRIAVTFTTNATALTAAIRLATDGAGNVSYTGDGTSGYYVWGAQLEASAFATSYIPTTTVAVTRAADTITLAGAALALARPASGWLVAKLPQGATSQSYTLVRKVSPSDAYLFAQSSSTASALVSSSGVANATIGGGGTFAGSVRYAVTWDGTGIANVANGGTISSTATPFGATDGSSMYLGSSGSGNNSINSYISRIAIGNTRLTNAQLQALSQ